MGLMRRASSPHRWVVVGLAGCGILVATFDNSAVSASLPSIAEAFRVDLPTIQWVVLSYLICIVSVLVTAGRIADILGRKRTYIGGLIVISVGSVIGALSPSVGWLIGARAIQGLGFAMLQVNALALIVAAFPSSMRGRALGVVGTFTGVGLVVGPVGSGLIVSFIGWRYIFAVTAIVGAAIALCSIRSLREQRGTQGESIDYLGVILLALWLGPLVFTINQGWVRGWDSPVILGSMAGAAVMFAVFLVSQQRSNCPNVDLSVFKIRSFRLSIVSAWLGFSGLTSSILLTPFYLRGVHNLPPHQIGLMVAITPAMLGLLAVFSGWISDRVGPRIPGTIGLVIVALGLTGMGLLDEGAQLYAVGVRLALVGVGLGLFEWPINHSIVGSLPRNMLGLAGGYIATARTVGFSTGQAIWGAVYFSVATSFVGITVAVDAPGGPMVAGFRVAFFAAGVVTLLAASLSALQGEKSARPSADSSRR